METNVTVIIPVYNAELYLKECLDSVLRQSLTDIEVICIDDGSSDGSAEILEQYVEMDKRINVIHQKNLGVAKARNDSMQIAKGKYIAFMDADDYYPSDDVLEALYNKAETNEVVISGGEFSVLFPDGTIDEAEKFKDDPFEYGYFFEKEGITHFCDYQFDYGFHRFIFLREFLISNNIMFPNLKRFQDPPFLVDALSKAETFYALKKTVYRYRLKATGIHWDIRRIKDLVTGIMYIHDFAQENGYDKLLRLMQRRMTTEYGHIILQICNRYSEDENIVKMSISYKIGLILTFIPRKIVHYTRGDI